MACFKREKVERGRCLSIPENEFDNVLAKVNNYSFFLKTLSNVEFEACLEGKNNNSLKALDAVYPFFFITFAQQKNT